jgi:hypothetical protein
LYDDEQLIETSTLFGNRQLFIRKPAFCRPQPEGTEHARQLVSSLLPYFSFFFYSFSLFICLLDLPDFFLISFLPSFRFTLSHPFPLSFFCISFTLFLSVLFVPFTHFRILPLFPLLQRSFPVCIRLLHFALPYFLTLSVAFIIISHYSVSLSPFRFAGPIIKG